MSTGPSLTYAQAIAAGAGITASQLLAQGEDISNVSSALAAMYDGLPGNIAALIASNTDRQRQGQIASYERGDTSTLPESIYRLESGLPYQYRYLVAVTVTNPDTGATNTISQWIDSDTPLTFDEAVQGLRERSAAIAARLSQQSPVTELDDADLEYEFTLQQAKEDAGI